jgi:peptidoglycan/xylan/chitin deacetylase (PgdA/CDA1 family)
VTPAPSADPSLPGKLRRRAAAFFAQRPLRRNPERPIVSFSFDDAPASALETGAGLLEAAEARGTFYVCAGLFGAQGPMGAYADVGAVGRAAQAGHEIGCHTLTHLACGPADPRDIDADAGANRDRLAALCGVAPTTFAYPFGDLSLRAKRTLAPRYALLRSIRPGLMRRGADLNQAPAVGIEGPDGEDFASLHIERAARTRAWLILYTHDVAEAPSPWGCTPQALSRLILEAKSLGCEILPVDKALAQVERRA